MNNQILRFDLENELDLVLAHKRAIQLGSYTGLSISEQTRFATAVSEISRNCLEYAGKGKLTFEVKEKKKRLYISCTITDKGPGIENIDEILKRPSAVNSMRGVGIANSMRLVEHFEIETDSTSGTTVILGFPIKTKKVIDSKTIQLWLDHFAQEIPVSPYEELKFRNHQLLKLSEELQKKNDEAQLQLKEIEKLNDELERKNAELKEFAYIVSHDFKTPLTSLKLWLQMANEEKEAEKKNSFITRAMQATRRAEETTKNLVEVIESQKDQKEIVGHHSIKALIEKLQAEFEGPLKLVNGTLNYHVETEYVHFRKAYLESIFKNLISNAIKYRSPDRQLEINIKAYRQNEFLILSVEDNGMGIDLNKHEKKIFEPFGRIAGTAEGKGIGLYILKNIIEKGGGKIEVESEPGKGSKFICFIKEAEETVIT